MFNTFLNKAVLLSLVCFFIFRFTSPGETPYNYFSLLAHSFSQGKIYLDTAPSHLNELIPVGDDKYYVPYAPMPAIVLFLPTLFLSHVLSQTFFAQAFAALFVFVTICNAYLITKSKKASLLTGVITGLGSGVWFLASVGSSWYFGQIVGMFFLSLSIYLKLSQRRLFTVGLALGCAYLARPHLILTLPFFLYNNQSNYKVRLFIKNFASLVAGISPALLFNFLYNYLRFGVIYDKGYALIPGVLKEVWYEKGIFHYSYINRQLSYFLAKFPALIDRPPFIVPRTSGMAFWLTNPAVFIALFARFDKKNLIVVLSAFFVLLTILMHGAPGFTQFGYRYALDTMPLLLLLIAQGAKRSPLLSRLLAFFSIAVNAWGVVTINLFNIYIL